MRNAQLWRGHGRDYALVASISAHSLSVIDATDVKRTCWPRAALDCAVFKATCVSCSEVCRRGRVVVLGEVGGVLLKRICRSLSLS